MLRMLWLCAALLGVVVPAHAHKSSDAYLQLDAGASGMTLRWDIALRDLDAALDLDADEDGKLTWAEVKTAWPQVQDYALARLQVDGCTLRATDRALERRNDGAYAVLLLASDCVLSQAPVIHYSLFREVDPTHRGIARVQRAGQPLVLAMLDPSQKVTSAPAADRTAAPAEGEHPAADSRWEFLREGVRHILTGYDHVLFLLCLLLPSVMRRTPEGWRPVERLSQAVLPVVGIVTAFTLAHSITLALAALKIVSLPPWFIEPAIAVTIILAALDNVWPIFPVRRVVVTFVFGLIHGFGFAGVLAELNLPTSAFAWALLQFNVGLELGQLLIVVCVTALLFLLRERPAYRSWVIRGGSFAAILVGVLWLIERTANVSLMPI
ncbi:MAG: HupE/UreJ family protein [Burkholderiales bacterium]|nr:HupE/UreJ family protein [Burkholderiales bacterium]